MVERGGRLGFALEAAERLRIASHLIGQEFQRHKAVQPCVFRLVNHAHTAATELLNDAVMRDGLAEHQGQILRG